MDIELMETLRHAPIFKLAICFLGGIILADQYAWTVLYASIACLPIWALCMIWDHKLISWRYEYMIAGLIYLTTASLGAGTHLIYSHQAGTSVKHINCRSVHLSGLVVSKVKQNEWGRKAWLEVKSLMVEEKEIPISGKIQLYISPKDSTPFAQYDLLAIHAHITDIRSKYPTYLKYLHRNNIFHAAYVDSFELVGIEKNASWYFQQAQNFYATRLSQLIPDPKLSPLAQAMFVGDKTNLSESSRETFATAGSSHILAISGLHIGIIYLLLSSMLKGLHRIRRGKQLKNIIILVVLVLFMCLTGATPAVIRAVAMYGFILLFKICYQRYHILNILAISAFIQMLWDTSIIFSISFQLSYVAVSGIVILFPMFERAFPSDNQFLKKLYACIGVSLCATLATAPLVIIYFGQFPTYFLLTNILITVLTGGTVFAGFILVMLIYIPYLNQLCAYLCYALLHALNWICEWIADLPYALIEQIAFDEPAIYLLILQLVIAFGILTLPRWLKFTWKWEPAQLMILQKAN